MQTLRQNRIFHKREFKILESKLSYKETIPGKSDFEAIIPYQELSNYKASHSTSNVLFLVFSMFTYFLAFISFTVRNDKDAEPDAWIFFIVLATFLLILFIIYRQTSWKIKLLNNNTYVFVYKTIPNEEVVNEFVDNIFSARNKYLKDNYMNLDRNLNYEDQYKNLKWLHQIEAISKQEFEEKYQELRILFNYDKKTIGF